MVLSAFSYEVSCGVDDRLRTWDAATGQEVSIRDAHEYLYVHAAAPDGGMLAAGIPGGGVRLWDRGSGQEARTRRGTQSCFSSLAFRLEGQMLAAGDDGTVKSARRRRGPRS